ncbi:MAG TPA: DUF362 domain-containing protein [Chthonomonadaceae bacterium]|nr:DUF362 domain-containing protein [Chthonomonadaceae bacterium]
MDPRTVSAYQAETSQYPCSAPFHPDRAYPEYTLGALAPEPNHVYHAVRECFRVAGLDVERFGTPAWNPLADLLRPGETVLLKPNLVKECHPRDPEGWQYVLTHGSVIRAVADYVWKALEGRGKVIVADAPQTDSSFAKIRQVLQLDAIRDLYRNAGLDFEIVDLRREEYVNKDGVIVERTALPGDPNGYIAYDLADSSEFVSHNGGGRYYGADYDDGEVNRHHTGGRHEYLISGTAILPDVVFSLPKLKTHKKAGITVSLKNLVGINGEKNWLPHHTEAGADDPGDERPLVKKGRAPERLLVRPFRYLSLHSPIIGPWLHRQARRVGRKVFGDTEEVIRSGNWHGNDTIWRMCLDLNKIICYGNPDGTLRPDTPDNRKRHYALVDGIVAGEGRGPMNPDPVPAGLILFGLNCPSVDAACAWLMGFDPDRIPIVRQAFRCRHFPLAEWDWRDVRLVSNRPEWNRPLPEIPDASTLHFKPHFGWVGHVERRKAAQEVIAHGRP